MKVGKWVLGIAALALLLGGTVQAQTIMANRLCINNGGEYYTKGNYQDYSNYGAGKYYPSFTHSPNTPLDPGAAVLTYPWKIMGWAWTGMQADNFTTVWYWETVLQATKDNPRAAPPGMSWDYPVLFYTGQIPHTGGPRPAYGGTTPTTVGTAVGGQNWLYPSSAGGWDGYLNIFAWGAASWNVPSTQPYYGWQFAFLGSCASAITLPSLNSVWEFIWAEKGFIDLGITGKQYMILSSNEIDCLGGTGNTCRNYSLTSDVDNGYYWYWQNTCDGVEQEWDMCLFVCDAVMVPVNVPGAPNAANPFYNYGFDVGSPTITPYLTSGCLAIGFMTEDYTSNPGDLKFMLAAFAFSPGPIGPFKAGKYRLTHGWDILTNLYLALIPVFTHVMVPGYPACKWGTTNGGHSVFLPFPPDPALAGQEIWYTSLSAAGLKPSASYMVTYF
jgi:hypothetical protein